MYSKREVDLRFSNLEEKIMSSSRSAQEKSDAWNSSILQKLGDLDKYKLTPVLAQVKLTNGRVSSLEGTRTWFKGAAYVIVPIFSLVAGWLILQVIHLRETSILNAFNSHIDISQ